MTIRREASAFAQHNRCKILTVRQLLFFVLQLIRSIVRLSGSLTGPEAQPDGVSGPLQSVAARSGANGLPRRIHSWERIPTIPLRIHQVT
ncbi:hypothetical protein GCM10023235_00900 [Kitasatospora terrestris]|uniref:Uncharacterized protein n=1 Tax=Kitasatospora terrestris TaxID=258051 RepID=A0ABP9D7T2_9ACTN